MRKNKDKARENNCSGGLTTRRVVMHPGSQRTMLSLSSAVISILVVLAAITPAAFAKETTIGTADLDYDSSEVTEAQIQSVETEFSTSTKPGDFAYSFKRFGEWFREIITFNQDDKARIKIEFARERLAEAKLMADLGSEDEAADLAEEAQEQTERARQLMKSRGIGNETREIAKTTDDVLAKSILLLQLVREKVSDNAQEKIDVVIEKMIDKRAEIKAKMESRQNASDEEVNQTALELKKRFKQKAVERFEKLNERLHERLENRIEELQEEFAQAIEEEDEERADELQDEIEKLENNLEKIDDRREKLSGKFSERNETRNESSNETDIENNNSGSVGFWKNHPENWLVENLTIGNSTLSKEEAMDILEQHGGRDVTYKLAAQLIATKLNIASGTNSSSIDSVVENADEFLMENVLGTDPQGEIKEQAEQLKNALENFNSPEENETEIENENDEEDD